MVEATDHDSLPDFRDLVDVYIQANFSSSEV